MTNHDDQNNRDHELGSALQSLTDPPSRDNFWDDLERQLAELDGDAPAEGRPGATVTDIGAWQKHRGRVLLAAAVIILAIGGAALLTNPFADDSTSIDATEDGEDGPNGDPNQDGDESPDNEADDEVDGSAEEDGDAIGTRTNSVVDYESEPTIVPLPQGATVVAAAADADAILVTVPVPNTEGSGCEGMGISELAVVSTGGPLWTPSGDDAGYNVAIPGPNGRFALGGACEESQSVNAIGSLTANGNLQIDQTLASAYDEIEDLVNLGRPAWSSDGSTLYSNAFMVDNSLALVAYDVSNGEVIGSEPISSPLVAELKGGVRVTETSDGLSVAGTDVSLITAPTDALWLRSTVSHDRARLAAWNNEKLVIVDDTGSIEFDELVPMVVADAAWTPNGRLIVAGSTAPELLVIDPDNGLITTLSLGGLDSLGWHSINVADGGRVVALSRFGEADETTAYALTFPATATDDTDQATEDSEPTAMSDYPLTLRGMGPIQIGMTVAEASAAIGQDINVFVDETVSLQCHYADVAFDDNSPWLMVITEPGADPQTGVIARIELKPNHFTASGLSTEASLDEALAIYGDNIEIGSNHYTDEPELTFVPTDTADSQYRMIIETADGRVTDIRTGRLPEVEYVEGCL